MQINGPANEIKRYELWPSQRLLAKGFGNLKVTLPSHPKIPEGKGTIQ